MAELLADVVTWMEALPALWIYATLLAVGYVENVIPPIPGDLVVVFGGYLVGMGVVSFVPVVAACALGGTLGFLTLYAVGRRYGTAVFDPDRLRWVPKARARYVRRWVGRYGYGVVTANRFLAGARSVISLSAGAARLEPLPTALYALLSAVLWCVLLVGIGYAVGEGWEVLGEYLRVYGLWVSGLFIFGAGYAAGRWVWRRQPHRSRRSRKDPCEATSRRARR